MVVVGHVHRRQQPAAGLLAPDDDAGPNVWIARDAAGKVLQPNSLDLQGSIAEHGTAQHSVTTAPRLCTVSTPDSTDDVSFTQVLPWVQAFSLLGALHVNHAQSVHAIGGARAARVITAHTHSPDQAAAHGPWWAVTPAPGRCCVGTAARPSQPASWHLTHTRCNRTCNTGESQCLRRQMRMPAPNTTTPLGQHMVMCQCSTEQDVASIHRKARLGRSTH